MPGCHPSHCRGVPSKYNGEVQSSRGQEHLLPCRGGPHDASLPTCCTVATNASCSMPCAPLRYNWHTMTLKIRAMRACDAETPRTWIAARAVLMFCSLSAVTCNWHSATLTCQHHIHTEPIYRPKLHIGADKAHHKLQAYAGCQAVHQAAPFGDALQQ